MYDESYENIQGIICTHDNHFRKTGRSPFKVTKQMGRIIQVAEEKGRYFRHMYALYKHVEGTDSGNCEKSSTTN